MGLAQTSGTYNMSYTEDNRIEETVKEVSEETGLDLDAFDGFMVDPYLPDNVRAQTQNMYVPDQYGNVQKASYMVVNDDFFDLSEEEQKHIALHEKIHGLDFKYNGIENVLKKSHDISDDLYDQISRVKGSRKLTEGMTEALTRRLDPNDSLMGRYVYPYETRAFEKLLEKEEVNLDAELLEGADLGYDTFAENSIDLLSSYVPSKLRYDWQRGQVVPSGEYEPSDSPEKQHRNQEEWSGNSSRDRYTDEVYGIDPDQHYMDVVENAPSIN